ncbi:hypothetical protein PVAP13_9KG010220 [Panicum virgatum]|uniref:Uncharacterized protein n=1 Tax=Panicum virgatum TaxID=38727 RepID=A0A8T0N5X6_PANVG|nr:hypothetical protein PVAP13_9KG010220 [Panicum virgatum]
MGRGACRGCGNTDQAIGAHRPCELSARGNVCARRCMVTQKGSEPAGAPTSKTACGGDGVPPFSVRAPAFSVHRRSAPMLHIGTRRHVRARRGMTTQKGLNGTALRRATHHAGEIATSRLPRAAAALRRAWAASTEGGRYSKSRPGIGQAEDSVVFVRPVWPRGSWVPPVPWRRPEAQDEITIVAACATAAMADFFSGSDLRVDAGQGE